MWRPCWSSSSSVIAALVVCTVVAAMVLPCAAVTHYASDDHVRAHDNKYRAREPEAPVRRPRTGQDGERWRGADSPCEYHIDVAWRAQLGSPVLSDPIVADLNSDGTKEIIMSTLSHYVEVVEGDTGHKEAGWPFAFPHSSFLSAPLLYDMNHDHRLDVLVTTEHGRIVSLAPDGIPLWNHTMRLTELVVDKHWYEGLEGNGVDARLRMARVQEEEAAAAAAAAEGSNEHAVDSSIRPTPVAVNTPDKLNVAKDVKEKHEEHIVSGGGRGLLFADDDVEKPDKPIVNAAKSMNLYLNADMPNSYAAMVEEDRDPLDSPTYIAPQAEPHQLLLPPHVLSTPVIADLNRDGREELIVAVSYFFDEDQLADLPFGVDGHKYAACGVEVFDLHSRLPLWRTALDLTTAENHYVAHALAPPTVADVTGDSNLEIVLGTGVGNVYVLDASGAVVPGWPRMTDAISSAINVDDVTGDEAPELIVLDRNDNLICFSGTGEELWETRIPSGRIAVDHAPVIGDVNGDGHVDIVHAVGRGMLYAVDGRNGEALPGFPMHVKGNLQASPTLIRMHGWEKYLHIVVHSTDGKVYFIDSKQLCFDSVDLGEPGFGSVLADDVLGDGSMDFLVTTQSGHLYCLRAPVRHHPLNTWEGDWWGGSAGRLAKGSMHGIYIREQNRAFRDIIGSFFTVDFFIMDLRRPTVSKPRHYDVEIRIGDDIVHSERYDYSGHKSVELPAPQDPGQWTIVVRMQNEFGQMHYDYFSLSFNQTSHRLIKWLLIGPFFVMCIVLIFIKELRSALPLGVRRSA